MAFALDTHEEGCTPLKPCRNCQALTFLRTHLKGVALKQFLDIVGVEISTATLRLPPPETPLKELEGFSMPILALLGQDNITTVGGLLDKSEAELLRMPNFGQKRMRDIREALGAYGLEIPIRTPPM